MSHRSAGSNLIQVGHVTSISWTYPNLGSPCNISWEWPNLGSLFTVAVSILIQVVHVKAAKNNWIQVVSVTDKIYRYALCVMRYGPHPWMINLNTFDERIVKYIPALLRHYLYWSCKNDHVRDTVLFHIKSLRSTFKIPHVDFEVANIWYVLSVTNILLRSETYGQNNGR